MGTKLEFTDSVQHNKELIATIIGEMPPSWRHQAKRAAVMVENTVNQIRADNSATPAPALGMAYAIFTIAAQLIEAEQTGDRSRILLLS